jgi:hypothetical protein
MSAAIVFAELLLRYGPDVMDAFKRWNATGKEPEPADWQRILAIARKTPDEYRREAEAELDRKL